MKSILRVISNCFFRKTTKSFIVLVLIGICYSLYVYSNDKNIKVCQLDTDGIQLSDTSFFYQTLCIHHDNFQRSVELDKLGDNGDLRWPMSYNKFGDTQKDDGFRIQDNKLVNTKTATSPLGIRTIKQKCGNVFYTEIAYPKEQGKHQTVVFQKGSNSPFFTFVDVSLNSSNKLIFKYGSIQHDVVKIKNTLIKTSIRGKNIKYLINKGRLSIYIDSEKVYESSKMLGTGLVPGIMISRKSSYSYKMFNVFQITNMHNVSPIEYIDVGEINNRQTRIKDVNATKYAHTSETKIVKDGLSERFELRYNDKNIKTSPRSEVTVVPIVRNNLRKYIISFDVYIPKEYEFDEYFDVLMQAHDTPADNRKDYGLNPNIALRTKDSDWFITVNGDYSPGGLEDKKYMYSSVNYLGKIKKGEWTHFDVFVKEGYMEEHNPLLIVRMNGKQVFKSSEPNCYNHPYGSYFKYGIYKADWKKGNIGRAKKRIVYFDNFTYSL